MAGQMNAAQHLATAEGLLAYAGSGPEGEYGRDDQALLTAALAHACCSIAIELGVPQPKTPPAAAPGQLQAVPDATVS